MRLTQSTLRSEGKINCRCSPRTLATYHQPSSSTEESPTPMSAGQRLCAELAYSIPKSVLTRDHSAGASTVMRDTATGLRVLGHVCCRLSGPEINLLCMKEKKHRSKSHDRSIALIGLIPLGEYPILLLHVLRCFLGRSSVSQTLPIFYTRSAFSIALQLPTHPNFHIVSTLAKTICRAIHPSFCSPVDVDRAVECLRDTRSHITASTSPIAVPVSLRPRLRPTLYVIVSISETVSIRETVSISEVVSMSDVYR